MPRGIDTEEQVDGATSCSVFERLVESLVARLSGTPDLVLQRLVNVILRIGLDNEIPRLVIT